MKSPPLTHAAFNVTTVVDWRWAAIEVLRDCQFSAKSDVWSFGVTCWEIFALGATPFSDIGSLIYHTHSTELHAETSAALVEELVDGKRLPVPDGCPEPISALMRTCWEFSPSRRPVCTLHFQHEFSHLC